MGNFLASYGIFLAKIITIVVAIMVVALFIVAISSKDKCKERLKIKKLNEKFKEMRETINKKVASKKELKKLAKEDKKQEKKEKDRETKKKRVFVIDFKGDIKASAVKNLREAITGILQVATQEDEIVAKIESQGGMIHSYGLAASQLQRIRARNIPLTVIIDKVAASGGYLMASVANKIYSAPFAIIGSIGVIAQLPNFNKLMKKHDIDYEQITAGEYKRTLTMLGENTNKGRAKMQSEVDEAHLLFKQFITENRPSLDIDNIATGEHWYGKQALELGLVDDLTTSDDYLLSLADDTNIYTVSYTTKKKFSEKFSHSVKAVIDHVWPFTSQTNPL